VDPRQDGLEITCSLFSSSSLVPPSSSVADLIGFGRLVANGPHNFPNSPPHVPPSCWWLLTPGPTYPGLFTGSTPTPHVSIFPWDVLKRASYDPPLEKRGDGEVGEDRVG
jgi:hypothetical protein